MADDSMIVNFDIGPDAFGARTAPKYKGGKWTDRAKANKMAKHYIRKDASKAAGKTDGTGEFNVVKTTLDTGGSKSGEYQAYDRSLKRKRGDNGGGGGGGGAQKPNAPQSTKNGEFVSSLWTQNPESAAVVEEEIEREDQAPTNAPLSDGSATFTTLGLSPVLANHLTMKLGLKAPTAIQKSAIPELITTDSDAFIQAETGSGKTLTYLLPIVNRIMSLSKMRPSVDTDSGKKEAMTRNSGLYAIIIAPTRELSRQILSVMTTLIHCKNGPQWIVPGVVIGGEKKKSEKARLRKGINILVATPGRLLDHLENTESLDVSRVRWLIMDEGDRLMELGLEETIGSILAILEKKSKLPNGTPERGTGVPAGEEALPKRRVTMLCSATMKTNVQRLGEISLKEALYIKAEKSAEDAEADGAAGEGGERGFMAPAQLKQSYVVVPSKLRLVGLNAVLKRAFIRPTACPRVIVFFSCSDSVDFHYEIFSRKGADVTADASDNSSPDDNDNSEPLPKDEKKLKKPPTANPAAVSAPLLHPLLLLHKLHGSLPQPVRTAALASFINTKRPSILFCTDVAARGLDLPNVDLVVQYDPPFSKDDHLHRIGRTARAGREGRAVMFLLPGPEEGYVDAVLKKGVREGQLGRTDINDVFKKGFGAGKNDKKRDWEDKASEWHLDIERWLLEDVRMKSLGAKAWGSHIRAYTTHVSAEKGIFNHKALHYGHLAKSFGLRDKPGDIKVSGGGQGTGGEAGKQGKKRGLDTEEISEPLPGNEAMKKMRKIAQAMVKRKGMSSEFNLG